MSFNYVIYILCEIKFIVLFKYNLHVTYLEKKNKIIIHTVLVNIKYLIIILQKGLVCCIEIYNHHTHSIKSAESLRFIPADDDVKNMFNEYFDSGMGISESQRYHEQLLELKGDFTLEHFGNGGINTCYRTVCNWHDTWRSLNLGTHSGDGLIEVNIKIF